MFLLYDAHTHSSIKYDNTLRIEQYKLNQKPSLYPFSISLHPWDINQEFEIEQLNSFATHPLCIAIGETGLDKLRPNLSLQEDIFRAHIRIAKQVQKPLIIHCVKAYDQCLSILEQEGFKHGVLFHGFNKHPNLASQLIKKGFYISLGAFFLKENPNFERFLIQNNFKGVMFETDNDALLHVESLYQKAKQIHPTLDIVKTINQTFNNWKEK